MTTPILPLHCDRADVSLAVTEKAGNWTRFRAARPAQEYPPKHSTVPSRRAGHRLEGRIAGDGHSSPVVWGDNVYVTSGEKATGKRIVLCIGERRRCPGIGSTTPSLSTASGTVMPRRPGGGRGGGLCQLDNTQGIYAAGLDHDGKELWRQNLGEFTSQWGSGTSPVVVNDMVVLTNDQEGPESSVAAFDHKTGKLRWSIHARAGTRPLIQPCLFNPKDGLPSSSSPARGTAYAPSIRKTARNWAMGDLFKMRTIGSPIVAGDLVIGTCGSADRQLIAVRPGPGAVQIPRSSL